MKYILLTCDNGNSPDEIEVHDIHDFIDEESWEETQQEEIEPFWLIDDLIMEIDFLRDIVIDLRQEVNRLDPAQPYRGELLSDLFRTSYEEKPAFKKYKELFQYPTVEPD